MPYYFILDHRASGCVIAMRIQERDRQSAIKRLRKEWSHIDPIYKPYTDYLELVETTSLDLVDRETIAISQRRTTNYPY